MNPAIEKAIVRLAALATVVLCCGCNQIQMPAANSAGFGGRVMGGQQPVSTATIQLYEVGTTGDGSAATPLLTSTVTTGANGSFSLTGLFTCPTPTTLVYLVASGGNPGLGSGTNNTSIALLAAIGQCQTLGPGTFISVNEVTTVAALAALAPYFTSPSAIGSGSADAAALNTAFTLAADYASSSTGVAGNGVAGGFAAPTQPINTLANILSSCVNTSGGAAGDGSNCGILFSSAKAGSTAPTDVATALVNIVNNPAANVGSLYGLSSALAPFQPTLSVAPSNWTWPIMVWGGAQETIALKSDGTVWTWGNNTWGELGNNSIANSAVPVQVLGVGGTGTLAGIRAVMGAESHNVALKSDGTVLAWGWNALDQLGDGNLTTSEVPTQVSLLTNVVALGSRAYHTLAVKSDGTVWAWGYDKEGALGNGVNDTNSDNPVPIQVAGVTNPIMVSAGYCFSVALLQDHTLVSWGKNNGGQLGNGNTADDYSPAPVTGIDHVAWVSAGWGQVLAVKTDGTVWAWGSNTWGGTYPGVGLLGNGTTANSSVPVQITTLSGAVMASGGDSMSAVLLNDGTVWTFGSNGAGQLGNGTNDAQSLVPVQVTGLNNIVFITARDHHLQAIRADGTVWSWGDGLVGELGNGLTANSNVPVRVLAF